MSGNNFLFARVHELFCEQVKLRPNALAVRDGDNLLSYEELERQSNQLAHFLLLNGVSAGDLVVLLTGRSSEAVVALLAILKAGAAYLPLDPAYPIDLLEFMMQDAKPSLVLYDKTFPYIQNLRDSRGFDLGLALEAARGESDRVPDVGGDGEDLAYVMYTSGSTGRPKGVCVKHQAVAHLVLGQDYAPFGPDQKFLHLAPLAFDASTFEIWGALLNGASIGIVGEARPSLDQIADALDAYRITTAWFTAGLFNLLVDHRLSALEHLQCILAGGEALSPTHVEAALKGLPHTRLVNGYGPTENTTFTCCYSIPPEGWGGGAVPIGVPLVGTDVYILDDDLVPVASGQTGQLCVGGLGVARGYLNRPELTAQKFVRNPFDSEGTTNLYLTGDLVRLRSDGMIAFLGRADQQVKINGRRIELEEISNVLRDDPQIADAVVVVDDSSGVRHLVAYLKPAKYESVSTATRSAWVASVLARLGRALPDYMVPHEVVFLETIPLTPNGKVDRRRLPPPERPTLPSDSDIIALSDLEKLLLGIWKNILKVDSIPLDRNFFDLGGTSLQLVAAHAEIEKELNKKFPLVALFQYSNIMELASFLGETRVDNELESARTRASKRSDNLRRFQKKASEKGSSR